MKRCPYPAIFVSMFIGFLMANFGYSQGSTDPVVFGGKIIILQDFVDNFEKGLEAGGTYQPFGDDVDTFALEDTLVKNGSFSGRLQTDAEGFNDGTFIGVGKSFTVRPIDASASNVVSYWVRGDGDANPPSVQIEFVIDNGSKWKQTVPTELTDTYERVVLQLNETDFSLAEGSGDFDLSMINEVNLILTANASDSGGTQRILYVDDIVLFNNPRTLTLSQTSVFEPSDGTSQVTITALVEDDDVPVEGVGINFVLSSGDGSLGCTNPVTTDADGEAECIYTVGDTSDIVEIVVEEE